MRGARGNAGIWRPSLERIDSTVTSQLGPGRVAGNHQAPCFSRQISMYLAKHVAGWSMVKIGRFYNGRPHAAVLHAIRKVEQLRASDDAVDALIEVLTAALREDVGRTAMVVGAVPSRVDLIEMITARVLDRLGELRRANVASLQSEL